MNYEKHPLRWLSAVSLVILSACSTMPGKTPSAVIDPPPAHLVSPCLAPEKLFGDVTVDQLIAWTVDWMEYGYCESTKRDGIIKSWPK